MADPDLRDIERRMDGAVEVLRRELAGLRTGRASLSLLEPVMVEAYDTKMPLSQVATIGAPEPRLLSVQVWDKSLVKAVENAIRAADLGLNPASDGSLVRVPIPEISEERRLELTKIAAKYSEQAKVSVRNVRRDGMEMLKRMQKAGEISQDEQHAWAEDIQKLTNDHIKRVEEVLANKEREIMQV